MMATSAKDLQLHEVIDTRSETEQMLRKPNRFFQKQIDYLTKNSFAPSSEKRSTEIPCQLHLLDEAEAECPVRGSQMELIDEEYVRREVVFIPAKFEINERVLHPALWLSFL